MVFFDWGELLEFEDEQGGTLVWELKWETNSLITSGRNGLLRYRMNDLVEVTDSQSDTHYSICWWAVDI